MLTHLLALAASVGVPVQFQAQCNGTDLGTYWQGSNRICIKSSLTPDKTVEVLAHELVHVAQDCKANGLFSHNALPLFGGPATSAQREIEAHKLDDNPQAVISLVERHCNA